MNTPMNHPLETLVISNLAQLIHAEKSLTEHYSRASQTGEPTSQERTKLSSELAALSTKADRLHRMILAMDQMTMSESLAEAPALV